MHRLQQQPLKKTVNKLVTRLRHASNKMVASFEVLSAACQGDVNELQVVKIKACSFLESIVLSRMILVLV